VDEAFSALDVRGFSCIAAPETGLARRLPLPFGSSKEHLSA
jgi:hypothetical protein